jgi:hypothetical protein
VATPKLPIDWQILARGHLASVCCSGKSSSLRSGVYLVYLSPEATLDEGFRVLRTQTGRSGSSSAAAMPVISAFKFVSWIANFLEPESLSQRIQAWLTPPAMVETRTMMFVGAWTVRAVTRDGASVGEMITRYNATLLRVVYAICSASSSWCRALRPHGICLPGEHPADRQIRPLVYVGNGAAGGRATATCLPLTSHPVFGLPLRPGLHCSRSSWLLAVRQQS